MIDEFISEVAGSAVSGNIVDAITSTIDKLADFPHVGTVRNETVQGLRAIPSAGKAVICFIVNDDEHQVKVVCVTYAGQNWEKLAASREAS